MTNNLEEVAKSFEFIAKLAPYIFLICGVLIVIGLILMWYSSPRREDD